MTGIMIVLIGLAGFWLTARTVKLLARLYRGLLGLTTCQQLATLAALACVVFIV